MAVKKTPMYERHVAAKGRMVEYGGWNMPVQYETTGIKTEHLNVRSNAGLFDVSHMGRSSWRDLGGAWISSRDERHHHHEGLPDQYVILCNEAGGVVDDLLVYRYDKEKFLLVVNAANVDKDWRGSRPPAPGKSRPRNISDGRRKSPFRVPRRSHPRRNSGFRPLDLAVFHFVDGVHVAGSRLWSAGRGTQADGFEICTLGQGAELWDAVMEARAGDGLLPSGSAPGTVSASSRALFGHEYTDEISPIEAGVASS